VAAQLTVKVSGIVQASPQRVFEAMTARRLRAWCCTFATEARRELHRAGWTDTLARLASHLASA
jgi:uncharacterized protein YndB with AHSA1/START domain